MTQFVVPILIGLPVAAAVAWWLYSGAKVKSQADKRQRAVLAALRFLTVLALCVVVAGITLKISHKQVQRPIVLVAQDNSSSIVANADSAWYRTDYIAEIEKLQQQLGGKFEVRPVVFSDKVTENEPITFDGQNTNIAAVFDYVQTNFYGENIGALIIASDGIANQGADPLHKAGSFNKPIYTIALGDTLSHPDLSIDRIVANRTAFHHSRFPIMVCLKGEKVPAGNYQLTVTEGDKVLESRPVAINSDYVYQKELFYIDGADEGLHRYDVRIDVPENDANKQNNRRSVVVDVSDKVVNVLLLQNSWHPDVSAIAQVLSRNERYKLTIKNIADFDGRLADYSLLILHQLPSSQHRAQKIVEQAREAELSILFIVGNQTDMKALGSIAPAVGIEQKRGGNEDAFPLLNADFLFFKIDFDATQTALFPPLNVPYGDYRTAPVGQVLFYQKIGAVGTQRPLIYFATTATQKIGVVAGEGLWRWRLADYASNGSHLVTDEIITKSIQYLCTNEKKDRFEVTVADVVPMHREVLFDAVLYNLSMEPVTTAEVVLELTDPAGNRIKSAFQPTAAGYTLNIGRKPAGLYRYTATATLGDEVLTRRGQFMVVEESAEMASLQANHSLLFQLADSHGGRMFLPDSLNSLADAIIANNEITDSVIVTTELLRIIDLLPILLLALAFLSAEWFLRKFWGMD